MSPRAHGQIRQSQVITTYGPGALIDLPDHAAIVGGLDTWPSPTHLTEVVDDRLSGFLWTITGIPAPKMYAPPPEPSEPWASGQGIGAWRFPEWFVVQETNPSGDTGTEPSSEKRQTRSRRLVHRRTLDDRRRYEGLSVVPTRFVRACRRGHVDDLDWDGFVHGPDQRCGFQLWLDETGTTGDLADLVVRCDCRKSRRLYEATDLGTRPLGSCRGTRPWLGLHTAEVCKQPSRLLIRTASNAYFPQVVGILSLPDRSTAVEKAVNEIWDDLQIVFEPAHLAFIKAKPIVAEKLDPFADAEVMRAIEQRRSGTSSVRSIKEAELEALLKAPEGFGDDVPIEPDFHARQLPDAAWRDPESRVSGGVESVIQLHRLREVLALIGFTRFEAAVRDIHGEYESDVRRADIATEPSWFPAIENRGEGVFAHLRPAAVHAWLQRTPVKERINELLAGHTAWRHSRGKEPGAFPRRPLYPAPHPGPPSNSVDGDAVRVPGEFHTRTRLCGGRPLRPAPLYGFSRRGGDARRSRSAGAPLRATPRPRARYGTAVFQRPDLRPALRSSGFRGTLATRSRLSRMHPDRRDLLRDAKRLPR